MPKISTNFNLTVRTKKTHSPYRRPALSKQAQPGKSVLDPSNAVRELLYVPAELLTEGQRGGVLQVRTTDLDDLFESLGLRVQSISQLSQSRNEVLANLNDGGNMHDGGEGVVRALAHVNVVIRVDWLFGTEFTSEHLDCPVRNDLTNGIERVRR